MDRTLTLALVPTLLMVTCDEAYAQRFLAFGGQGTAGTAGGVPAGSGVGLAIMVVATLAAGGFIVRKRTTALAP